MVITPAQAESMFLRCVANAIIHVNELRVKRPQLSFVEQIGMFATAVRREMIGTLYLHVDDVPGLRDFCHKVSDKKIWAGVGKPKMNFYYHSDWNFKIKMGEGDWIMDSSNADRICQAAIAKASYESDAEKTIEINHTLVDLETSLRNMRAGVTVAAGINAQAEQVIDSLYKVAEKLTA